MTDPSTETRSIVVEREMPHPPEKIWRALTQPHLIAEWLMTNDFVPEVGHRFQLRRDDPSGYRISIDCRVLAIEPNRMLSYAWDYIVGDPAYDTTTVVTFTLTPTGTGTHLRMEQSGFRPDQRQALAGGTSAWRTFVDALEALLARTD